MEGIEKNLVNPELDLLAAVLKRAIRDYASSDQNLSREAASWLTCNTDGGTMDQFSFEWICEQLGLNCCEFLREIKDKRHIVRKINETAIFN